MPSRRTLLKLALALACAAAILWLAVGCQDPDFPCGKEALRHAIHVREVLKENRNLFRRQPGSYKAMEHFIRDDDGNWSAEYGIIIGIAGKKVDQYTLPPEDRIPDEIDGVAIYFDESPSNYTMGLIEGQFKEDPEVQYAYAAMWKYEDLFFRQFIPNYHPSDHGIMAVGQAPGEPMKVSLAINIFGRENALLLENRIPECVDGIPVTIHIIESVSEYFQN